MQNSPLAELLAAHSPDSPDYAAFAVDSLLRTSCNLGASDVHLLPQPEGLQVAWRIDGVLQPAASIPSQVAAQVVA
ncbi:MAG: hypothetical protein KDA61_15300, partial [Planctomycetales bacterium]|nr:hypothetical protein [Planctomycetales bacterium]